MVGGWKATLKASPAGGSANRAAPAPAILRPTTRPKPNRFIASWKTGFSRCTATIAENFWKSCSTQLPSTARSSIRSEWCSSTSPMRICAKPRIETHSRSLAQSVLVQGHADGGVHADFFEGSDVAASPDAASGDDRMRCCAAQRSKPLEVRAGHGAFAVYIGAEKSRAEGFELRHHFFGLNRNRFAPAVNGDASAGRVESDDDLFPTNFFCKQPQKSGVHFSAAERRASNNDLACAPAGNFLRSADCSNAASNADRHSKIVPGFRANVLNEIVIRAFSHGGIQINHVQPGILLEFL